MLIDVLIITALYDELQAVLALGDDHRAGWRDERDPAGFLYHHRAFPLHDREELRVAAAWSGAMGETAAADRSRGLIEFLKPLALAMSGICAGRRGDVFLGDVIVADRVFSYDHGKLIAATQDGHRIEEIFHDIETYNLEKAWAMDAAYFAPEREWQEELRAQRPLSLASQRGWLLRSLYAHQVEGADPPQSHPERQQHCPDWPKALESLRKDRFVSLKRGTLEITAKGRGSVLEERVRYVDGVPPDPSFKVHIGPIATGKAVRQDSEIFRRLAKFERKVLGVEMEAAAIGYVAERSGIPSIIAKAVSDYGDADKDDGFRHFACRASAKFLLSFLSLHPPRSLKRNQFLSIAGDELKALPQQIATEVLNSLLATGMVLAPPKGSPSNSLFFCERKGGGRAIGAALNNSGLIAYVGLKKLSRVISVDQKQAYKVKHLDIGNQFIHFAILNGLTQGLIPSYLNQMEAFTDWENLSWSAFDRNGKPVLLKLEGILGTIVISTKKGNVLLDDMIWARGEGGDGDILGGPVLSERNEIIGFAIAGSSSEPRQGVRFVVIWPWVSLANALKEARVLDNPSS